MMLKVLKISLFLILVVSFFGFVSDKNIDKNKARSDKSELVKELMSKKSSDVWKTSFRQSTPVDISNVKKSKERTKIQSDVPAAMPIADYYGEEVMQTENLHSAMALTGTVVGTSQFGYAIAYYGRNIAIGSNGFLHAIWCDAGDPANTTKYKRSEDGGETWIPETPIAVHDGYYGYKTAIAVDFNNPMNIHVAYVGYQDAGETRTVRYAKSEDGGDTWLPSFLVAGSAGNCNNPDIDVDSEGNPHVAFDSYADEFIRYNYSADGGATWLEEPEIATVGFAGGTFGASITIDPNDDPHVMFGGDGGGTSWGDKNVYWNKRDMASSTWLEVPPVQVSSTDTGTPYPSMVFDSNGIGHMFYDAAGNAQRAGFYAQYDPATGWQVEADHVEILTSIPGGNVMEIQVGIDPDDNLYIAYLDGLGAVIPIQDPEPTGDLFTGTNVSGAWQFVNVSSNGPGVNESQVNVTRHVLSDSVMHVLYESGPEPTIDIVYEVGYPWSPNPSCVVNALPNTFDLAGPFTVTANTGDLDGTVVSCALTVWVNGEESSTGAMSSIADNVWEADFTIAASPGDVVEYMATAVDNDGLEGQSFLMSFNVLEPQYPCADVLLVGDQMQIFDIFDQVISGLGYVYEYWDVDANGGIDASVTQWGWNNIILAGWAETSIPTRAYEDDNPYALFMEGGGNFAMMDHDYFFGQGEPGDVDLTFDAGDFAYDYLCIGGGVSDPTANDSVLIGIDGDAVTGSFAEAPFLQFFPDLTGITNFVDWAYSSSCDDIFYALNLGYECGVKNDAGSYKTVFLPFMFEWLVELDGANVVANADAYTLMGNILAWFEAGSPPMLSGVTGPRYGVYGTGPFDVYAEASDPILAKTASAITSVEVGYMTDDMTEYSWSEMTDNGDGSYSGQIPELAVGDTTLWSVRASDEDGCPSQTSSTAFWVTGMEATEGVEVLYCGYDVYDWYYACSPDSSVGVRMRRALDATTYAYDFWDVDVYGTPDYQTVLSNYYKVIWHGFTEWDPVFPARTADNPFADFVMNGGRLLCSSDELLGVASTYVANDFSGPWFDVAFGPGWAAFDVLGVAAVYNDYNYADMIIADPAHPMFSQMDLVAIDSVFTLDFCFDGVDWNFSDYVEFTGYCTMWGDDNAGSVYYANATSVNNLGEENESKVVFFPWQLGAVPGLDLRTAMLQGILDWFNLPVSTDKKVDADIPVSFALHNNYPNPFNPQTSIAYDLPKASKVELAIYNVMGQKIRTLISEKKSAGRYMATWDGQNDFGAQVATGVYFYRIMADDFVKSHKMMLMK